MQFEILKNPGIDFYSGFRKTSQGGGGCNSNSPVTSNPGSATDIHQYIMHLIVLLMTDGILVRIVIFYLYKIALNKEKLMVELLIVSHIGPMDNYIGIPGIFTVFTLYDE